MSFTLILILIVPIVLFCTMQRIAPLVAAALITGGTGALTAGMGMVSANKADKEQDPDRPKRRKMTKNFERMMLAINAAWDRKQQAMIGLAQAHTAAADQLR